MAIHPEELSQAKNQARSTAAVAQMAQKLSDVNSSLGHFHEALQKMLGYMYRIGAVMALRMGVPRIVRGNMLSAFAHGTMDSRGGGGSSGSTGEVPEWARVSLAYHATVDEIKEARRQRQLTERQQDEEYYERRRNRTEAYFESKRRQKLRRQNEDLFAEGLVSTGAHREIVRSMVGAGTFARGFDPSREMGMMLKLMKLHQGMPFAQLDFETLGTGEDGTPPIPIQVGVTRGSLKEGIQSVHEQWLRPQRFNPDTGAFEDLDIEAEELKEKIAATAEIMGLTGDELKEKMKGGISYAEAFPGLEELMRGHLPMGANTQFDYSLYNQMAKASGRKGISQSSTFDILSMAPRGSSVQSLLEQLGLLAPDSPLAARWQAETGMVRGAKVGHRGGLDTVAQTLLFAQAIGKSEAFTPGQLEDLKIQGLPPGKPPKKPTKAASSGGGGDGKVPGGDAKKSSDGGGERGVPGGDAKKIETAVAKGTETGIKKSPLRDWFKQHAATGTITGAAVGSALLNAGAPDAAGFLFDSFKLLAAHLGQSLIPVAVKLALSFQDLASWAGRHIEVITFVVSNLTKLGIAAGGAYLAFRGIAALWGMSKAGTMIGAALGARTGFAGAAAGAAAGWGSKLVPWAGALGLGGYLLWELFGTKVPTKDSVAAQGATLPMKSGTPGYEAIRTQMDKYSLDQGAQRKLLDDAIETATARAENRMPVGLEASFGAGIARRKILAEIAQSMGMDPSNMGFESWKSAAANLDKMRSNLYGIPRTMKDQGLSPDAKDAYSRYLLGISHTRTQPQFMGVEEAYNRIALEAVGMDPLQKELERIRTDSLAQMLLELQKNGAIGQQMVKQLSQMGLVP